ncbi:valine--tRNA ligase [Candidatus Dojkabacteria bacterium]|nr:valine--tRNA ligase [Candidatus Dojkabacteria bacterium]
MSSPKNKTLDLPKGPYNTIQTEEEILEFWKKGKYFKPEFHAKKGLQTKAENDGRQTFCIICPPPNANARPHLGNLSGYSYQDLMGRFNRMLGKKTLLLPGKDHAGIQSEVVFERDVLKKQGKNKLDLGREEFYKQCYKFCLECAKMARSDEERVGLSADFDRDIFTLDPDIVKIILETFVKLYKDKQIYKGIRITNWCPKCQTALADIDCERKGRKAELTYIKYPLHKSRTAGIYSGPSITIATTRPETMLADTAVAVNPKDKRYKDLIGKTVILPLVEREIPIITDPQVDMEFGTGALKITPAHAPEDYDIMLRWNEENPDKKIDYINVIWKDSKLYGPVGKYKSMTVEQAKTAVTKDLRLLGLIEKTEEIEQNVSICERCKEVIEPIMSSQWYVKVDKIKKEAIDVVKTGRIKIHPKYMGKRYFQWMKDLRDWPISRSLWWGYRIPAWYKGKREEYVNNEGKIEEKIGKKSLNDELIKVQLDSPGDGWIQDDDVLDTWFSSGQWPYATLMKENLMDIFYPTDVMETMYDILEWWVSRMIMLGLYKTGKIPFKDVYLHGMLLAPDGAKMSKSKGNVISMDDIVAEHGADTLRLFYYIAGKAGSSYRFDWERMKFNRNFLNKIWNASKFVLMNIKKKDKNIFEKNPRGLEFQKGDKKMLKDLNKTIQEVTRNIERFKFNLAIDTLADSFWHTYCDEYLEYSKEFVYAEEGDPSGTIWTLWKCLKTYMELMHPFVPFITEKIWQQIPKSEDEPETIMYAKWPEGIIS